MHGWQEEARELRERGEQAKLDWLGEHEERLAQVQSLYERRQQMLCEENERLGDEKRRLEDELRQTEADKELRIRALAGTQGASFGGQGG